MTPQAEKPRNMSVGAGKWYDILRKSKHHTKTKKVPSMVIGTSQGHHENVTPDPATLRFYRNTIGFLVPVF